MIVEEKSVLGRRKPRKGPESRREPVAPVDFALKRGKLLGFFPV
jgi:hypothetical protein